MPHATQAPELAPSVEVVQAPPQLLEQIIAEARANRQPGERERFEETIGELVNQFIDRNIVFDGDLERCLLRHIAEIDRRITAQVDQVLHAPEFQRLEGTWRGLHDLVHKTQTSASLRIRALNVSKSDLFDDLSKAVEFDQSALFQAIYESEYGTYGGSPFGVIIGDYDFDAGPRDVEMLSLISGVAASAHAPFIAAASPEMFNKRSFTELDQIRDLAKVFESSSHVEWSSFRDSEDARYVALTLPRYLARRPYHPKDNPARGFVYEEGVRGADHSSYLWANSAYLLGQRITAAFEQFGWTTAIRGPNGGGKVEGLPLHRFETEEGDIATKIPTEIDIPSRREKELSDQGFMALCHCKGEDYAAFFGGQSASRPRKYLDDSATANAELGARLPYILAVSRIAHYLKAIVRDKVGGFETQESMQRYLERWISQYVLLDDSAPLRAKAERPLREARIVVEEVPSQPGSYQAIAHLRPHFQLETFNVSLRLVAKLPPAAQ